MRFRKRNCRLSGQTLVGLWLLAKTVISRASLDFLYFRACG
jgi:hypothetical protein